MAQKVEEKKRRGDKNIINLGVGDVKLPLFNCVIEEMKKASDEMGNAKTFKGYSPAEGYEFLREKIAREYNSEKVLLTSDEIFSIGHILVTRMQTKNQIILPPHKFHFLG